VDVISRSKRWSQPTSWFRKVAEIFKANGCKWGGDWTSPDLPHFQWGKCKPSPSDQARAIMRREGMQGVWRAVGAD
jgi:peptidoglycan L-alanyl-D-glutamate endopeptidase CwlK